METYASVAHNFCIADIVHTDLNLLDKKLELHKYIEEYRREQNAKLVDYI